METIVAKQINYYVLHFNIIDPKQRSFRKFHITETNLISFTDDILWTLDHNNNITVLLNDITSAFYTFKHDLKIDRLTIIGLSDTVLL